MAKTSSGAPRSSRQARLLSVALALLVGAGLLVPGPLRQAVSDRLPLLRSVQSPTAPAKAAAERVRFEENQGQADPSVRFFSRGTDHTVLLTDTESVFVVPLSENDKGPAETVRMRLDGASTADIRGEHRVAGITNYFIGNDPDRWVTRVASYGAVRYRDAYPGVDAVYYGNAAGELEYDFIVAPGADPSQIALSFSGHRSLSLDRGELVLATVKGEFRQQAPTIYQDVDGRRRAVPGRYLLEGGKVRFGVGAFDATRPLVIDPVLTYSTYLGGSGNDEPAGIAVDASGATYIAGTTNSIDFPLPPAPSALDRTCGANANCDSETPALSSRPDAFVTKLSPDGSEIIFSTYLGDSGTEKAGSLALDRDGGVYVAGTTDSATFPLTPNAFDKTCGSDGTCDRRTRTTDPMATVTKADVFVVRLSPDGARLDYSTYLGGSGEDGARAGPGTYFTTADAPTVARQEVPESVIQSGPTNGPHPGTAVAVAVDQAGLVYVAGVTLSPDFTPVVQTDPAFQPYDATCGTDQLCNRQTAVLTNTAPPATTVTFQPDAFVLSLDWRIPEQDADQAIRYATYLGGSGGEAVRDVAVGGDGTSGNPQLYLTGFTYSPRDDSAATPERDSFPTTGAAFQPVKPLAYNEAPDAPIADWNTSRARSVPFLARVDTAAAGPAFLRYSTFLGGSQENRTATGRTYIPDEGLGIVADGDGAAYVVGVTDAVDFPVSSGAFQEVKAEKTGTASRNATSESFVANIDTTRFGSNSRVFATYLGGIVDDNSRDVAVDAAGRVYVTGDTTSTAPTSSGAGLFPILNPLPGVQGSEISAECAEFARNPDAGLPSLRDCRDAFITVFEPGGGELSYSSLVRGSKTYTDGSTEESGRSVATWLDPGTGAQLAVLAGQAGTSDFPVVAGHQAASGGYFDGFVSKISPVTPPTPYVTGLSPPTGNGAGGTEVTLGGTGFTSATEVLFGTTPAAPASVQDGGTRLVVLSPPGIGTVDIRVRTPLGTSPRSSFGRFSYFTGSWASAPSNRVARYGHTATLLSGPNCGEQCGKILLVGGSGAAATSADLYDPASGTSVPADCPTCPGRDFGHTATLLTDGTVLVAGGSASPTTAQLYRPQTGTWETLPNPPRTLQGTLAVLLTGPGCANKCGQVLFVGRESQLFDSVARSWLPTGPMQDSRQWLHTATLISGPNCGSNCGKVLVFGGAPNFGSDPPSYTSAELYDPGVGLFTERTTAVTGRYGHTATLLSTGKVLIAGGIATVDGGAAGFVSGETTAMVEVYDPTKPLDEAFSTRRLLSTPRSGHRAVALPDGRALVVGGAGGRVGPGNSDRMQRPPLAGAEVFDPGAGAQGEWQDAGAMTERRGAGPNPGGHVAVLLSGPNCGSNCGKVLVIGGATVEGPGSGTYTDLLGLGYPPDPPALSSAELHALGPYVAGLDGATGPAEGGTAVTMTGGNFEAPGRTGPVSVQFGDIPAQSVQVLSPSRLVAVSPPAGTNDVVEVRVVVPGLGAAVAPNRFTYTGLPGRVGNLAAEAVSAAEVRLTFSAPGKVATAGGPAASYVVKQSMSPIDEGNFDSAASLCTGGVCAFAPARVGVTLTLMINSLTPETTYHYALRARNDAGQLGPMSNQAQTLTGPAPPGTVTDLTARSVSDTEVELSFTAPGSNGADPPAATRFVVKHSTVPLTDDSFDAATALCQGVCTLPASAVGERLTLTVKGLKKGVGYHFRLRAIDQDGNISPLSNGASATPACAAVSPARGQVAYPSGYSLVGVPEGTVIPSRAPLYGWFDLGAKGNYTSQDASRAVPGGRGYWALFSCPQVVTLAGAGASFSSEPLGAYRASMVGNPSASSPAVLSGHDFAARWDPTLNGGSGGYRISGYREPQTLAVGEGAWAFSYQDTTVTVRAQ